MKSDQVKGGRRDGGASLVSRDENTFKTPFKGFSKDAEKYDVLLYMPITVRVNHLRVTDGLPRHNFTVEELSE